jgi:4-diphosphocytidyl-2-C-methyl-D-erythritol kinase
MKAALLQSPDQWTSLLVNDFEAPVFELHPTLLRIKDILYNAGALYASLSGTGSTLYGVFNTPTAIPELESSGYFTKWI